MPERVVIVGAGMTGAAAVQALREEGFDGSVVLVGEEAHLPYERPPLSKEYLRGEQDRAPLLVHPADWYRDHDVDVRLGVRATRLDVARRAVTLSDGHRIPYDAVLLATGGRPRTLAPPSERVLYLRTKDDADSIRAHLGAGRHLLVVGAGFIGTEVAASARALGTEVTMIDVFDVPLQRAIGRELGEVFFRLHADHGVRFVRRDPVESIAERGASVMVRTESGATVEGDAAVVGIAIVPSVELGAEGGLDVDDGILVDERCRTSVPDIYAAGDVAKHRHPLFGTRLRVEHFDNALKHGAHAGRAMLGRAEAFDDPHWFWSDQYDVNLQSAGAGREGDELVVRGSVEERAFVGFYLREGVVVGAIGIDRGRDVRRAMKLIRARARPERAALRDEDVDLRTLIPDERGQARDAAGG